MRRREVAWERQKRMWLLKNATYQKYKGIMGKASNEIYAQFFIRIFKEISGCILGEFSKLKVIQAPNFTEFRRIFNASLEKMFVVPAWTFDNVKGNFPIGFFVWNCSDLEAMKKDYEADVFSQGNEFLFQKSFHVYDRGDKLINDWLRVFFDKGSDAIGVMHNNKNDFQHNNQVCITSFDNKDHTTPITRNNLIPMCIYLTIRHCIDFDWLRDRDQFLYPNDGWLKDKEFQTNCLIYTLFHGQNRITAQQGINHWIPFTREQVGCRKTFKSTFMSDYLSGKIQHTKEQGLFGVETCHGASLQDLSPEAQAVYDAGLALWRYYHTQPNAIADASFYDIRLHFQGTNDKGNMNAKSDDATYTALITDLREKMKLLAKRIEPKVYEYGFLK
jgi:hypothetical protein